MPASLPLPLGLLASCLLLCPYPCAPVLHACPSLSAPCLPLCLMPAPVPLACFCASCSCLPLCLSPAPVPHACPCASCLPLCLQRFNEYRSALDPKGVLSNDWLDKLLPTPQ